MSTKRKMALKGAPPSYEELKQERPKRTFGHDREEIKPQPIRFITCDKCHRVGGTLVKAKEGKYYHPACKRKVLVRA